MILEQTVDETLFFIDRNENSKTGAAAEEHHLWRGVLFTFRSGDLHQSCKTSIHGNVCMAVRLGQLERCR